MDAQLFFEHAEPDNGNRLGEELLVAFPVGLVGVQPHHSVATQPELQGACTSPVELNAAARPVASISAKLKMCVPTAPFWRAHMVHQPRERSARLQSAGQLIIDAAVVVHGVESLIRCGSNQGLRDASILSSTQSIPFRVPLSHFRWFMKRSPFTEFRRQARSQIVSVEI